MNHGATLRVRTLHELPPLGPGDHHVDVAAAAPGAEEPLAPHGNGGVGAVTVRELGGIKLHLGDGNPNNGVCSDA